MKTALSRVLRVALALPAVGFLVTGLLLAILLPFFVFSRMRRHLEAP